MARNTRFCTRFMQAVAVRWQGKQEQASDFSSTMPCLFRHGLASPVH
jgi:hypothetical protein